MKRIINFLIIATILGVFIVTSCTKDDETNETTEITLSVSGLPDLGNFYSYEGWLVYDNTAYSTGKFGVSSDSGSASFVVDAGQLNKATDFVVSIEPSPDPNFDPSVVHILAGTFIGKSCELTPEHELAIGSTFSNAAGKYILATPTNGADSEELSGVWWLDPSGPSKSLVLPELNTGWIYEGWTIINGNPVSTGKFDAPSMADNSDPYSAQLEAPSFPGEDFLLNAPIGLAFPTDLSGQQVVISVEPYPDISSSPFFIKPLIGNIPDGVTDHILYSMTNNSDVLDISGEVNYE